MFKRYDPLRALKPNEWLALDEDERIECVARFHKTARLPMPNYTVHAAFHAVVESQAAMGAETPLAEVIARLMSEGLDRREAMHAVGAVFAKFYFNVAKGQTGADVESLRKAYFDEVRSLTAALWRDALEPN